MLNNLRKAFTLPEILLALLIVGVLAALTIPIFQVSYQRNASQASFANTYKEINKALFKYSRENGGQGRLSTTTLFADANIAQRLSTAYTTPVFVGDNCWEGKNILNNITGSGATTNLNDFSCFIDERGTIYAFEPESSSCTGDLASNILANNKLTKSCGYVYFDVNGLKAPNTFGRDVFVFVITDNYPSYLYPVGGNLTNAKGFEYWRGNSCGDRSAEGRTCAARIIDEGWKINYFR